MNVIEQGTEPFRWWRLDELVEREQLRTAAANVPPANWVNWVKYSNDIEHGKRTTRELDNQHYALTSLSSSLNSVRRACEFGELAGVGKCIPDNDLHGAGLHITDPGGWLQVHVDYELHPRFKGWERRLNLIVWLNEHWNWRWGGALILCDPLGQSQRVFYPKLGDAILFEGGAASYHGAMQTSFDAESRMTLALYYLAEARPGASRRRALFLPNRDAPECPREVRLID